jgi:hypothetical protein
MRLRFAVSLLLCFLPVLAHADGFDPIVDPHPCSGSFAVTFVNGNSSVLQFEQSQGVFSTVFTPNTDSNPVCFSNTTGQTLNSMSFSTSADPNSTYSCPDGGDVFFANCAVQVSGGTVTFLFSGLDANHLGVQPFVQCRVFTTECPKVGEFTFDFVDGNGNPVDGEFGLEATAVATPEPENLALLGTAWPVLWSLKRRRRAS